MAAMDDLKELCEHGSETIEVARDWELLSQAREFLISRGYVEQEQQTGEDNEAQASIIFQRASRPDSSQKSSFRFPEKAPDPHYKSSGTRTSSSTAEEEEEEEDLALPRPVPPRFPRSHSRPLEEEEEDDTIFYRASPDSPPKARCMCLVTRKPKPPQKPSSKSHVTRKSEPKSESPPKPSFMSHETPKLEPSRTSSSITEWTLLKSFQHNTNQLPENKQPTTKKYPTEEYPKKNIRMQNVGIKMVVQPYVMLDNAHFNVRLQVQRLVVGVHKSSFLKPEKHKELGFYPYSIRLDMEPLVEGYDNLCAIPLVEGYDNLPIVNTPDQTQNRFPENSSSRTTTNTTVGAQIGYGPFSVNFSRTWGRQKETGGEKVEVVRIDEAEGGNSVRFKWKILRWASNEKYDIKKAGLKSKKELPFNGCAVSLESEIPDVWWKFDRKVKVVTFEIRLRAKMHLLWCKNYSTSKGTGPVVDEVKHNIVWELHQNEMENYKR